MFKLNIGNINNMRQMIGTASKKPVQINWFHWKTKIGPHLRELKAWVESFGDRYEDVVDTSQPEGIRILTLEGISYVLPDNYIIIRGIKGEYYPCEYEIFLQSYDIEEVKIKHEN